MFRVHGSTAFPVLLASLVFAQATSSAAAPIDVYLYNYAGAPENELVAATRLVSRLYAKSEVELRWRQPLTTGLDSTARPLQVVLMSPEMSAQKGRGMSGEAFGSASHDARRAYVFYDRVSDHALRFAGSRAVLLAAVIAHELGHLLLPPPAHSRTGLMSPHWVGRIAQLPDFEKPQLLAIRQASRETISSSGGALLQLKSAPMSKSTETLPFSSAPER